jgi:hypothetical protein
MHFAPAGPSRARGRVPKAFSYSLCFPGQYDDAETGLNYKLLWCVGGLQDTQKVAEPRDHGGVEPPFHEQC